MNKIPNHLQPGTMLHAGSYRIVRFIAAGGFGCTYEAEHILLEKRVAIKEFFMQDYCNRDADTNRVTVGTQSMHEMVDKYKRKFIGEAKALSGLRHEGIVSVSDVFEENGTAYFVMDYVKGQSLADLCKNGPLPEKHALYYIRQVCEALAYVHEHNRLHLDLKPANIMLEASGRTVLIDFGASKQYDAASGENTTTLLGYTPGYAPLEQTEGNVRQFLPATDIYALGATLYRLLTGHTPPSPSYRISEEEMQPLPDSISAGTRQAVECAMEIRKKDRPQSVREFVALLDAAVKPASQPDPADPVRKGKAKTGTVSLDEPQQKSRKVPTALLVSIIVVLCTALIVLLAKGCSTSSDEGSRDTLTDSIRKDSVVPAEKAMPVAPAPAADEVATPAPAEEKPVPAEKQPAPEAEKPKKAASATGTHAGHEWVDLGLSVKWATCNVGASSPSGYGNYYAWGETRTKSEYTEDNCTTIGCDMSDIGGNSSYDAARANWGGSWRLPTIDEFQELVNNCNRQWTTQNGVEGKLFTSKMNGNSIFFPGGGYWSSSTFVLDDTMSAFGLHFSSKYLNMSLSNRYNGRFVRPILK